METLINSQPKSQESRHDHKIMTFLPRPEELTQPIHFQVKATYMHLPKKEIQDKIDELQADQVWEGYEIQKQEFLTILQSLL